MQAEVSFNGRKSTRVVCDDAIRVAQEHFSQHSIPASRIRLEVTDENDQVPGRQHCRLTVFLDDAAPQVFEASSDSYAALLRELFESASSQLTANRHDIHQAV